MTEFNMNNHINYRILSILILIFTKYTKKNYELKNKEPNTDNFPQEKKLKLSNNSKNTNYYIRHPLKKFYPKILLKERVLT